MVQPSCEFCGAPEGFAGHYMQDGQIVHPIPMFTAKNRHAVALGRKGGKANKGIPKPASAANGLKGGRPKGSKNTPKKKP